MDIIVDPRLEEFKRNYEDPAQRRRMQRAINRNRYFQGGKIILSNLFVLNKALATLLKSIMGGYPLRSLATTL